MEVLPSGLPSLSDYESLLETPLLAEIRANSEAFLLKHATALESYRRRWVSDPLNQWSRLWEYPYTFQRVRASRAATADRRLRVLDAGSGVTFFPYLLADSEPADVVCVDADTSLGAVHANIRRSSNGTVGFISADLSELPFANGSFDLAYCVSVLEHTENYEQVALQLRRILKPFGRLVLTFDLSIDGDADITVVEARRLVSTVARLFTSHEGPSPSQLALDARSPDTLTTLAVAKRDRSLLPWAHPLFCTLRTLRRGRWPRRWGYSKLAVACYTFQA